MNSIKKVEKMAKNNQWVIFIIIGLIVAVMMGWVALPNINLGGGNGNEDSYPSDLKTSVTLYTGDALATTPTNVNASYYIFDSSGNYLKEGTTSSGTATFTVPTGGNYKYIVYDDTSGTANLDYIYKEGTFSTDGEDVTGRALKTVTVDLYRESNTTISLVKDPLDNDANISVGLGQTASFDVFISTETSKAAINNPVILVKANASCIEEVNFPALTKVPCPDRVTAGADRNQYCFKRDGIILSSEGIVTLSANILLDSSTECDTSGSEAEHLLIYILDTGIYKEPDYRVKGYSAFKYGTENPADNSNIGAGDSEVAYIGLAG